MIEHARPDARQRLPLKHVVANLHQKHVDIAAYGRTHGHYMLWPDGAVERHSILGDHGCSGNGWRRSLAA